MFLFRRVFQGMLSANGLFAECPMPGTRQSIRLSAKAGIPVVPPTPPHPHGGAQATARGPCRGGATAGLTHVAAAGSCRRGGTAEDPRRACTHGGELELAIVLAGSDVGARLLTRPRDN